MNSLKAAGAVSAMTLRLRITGLAREVIGFAFFGSEPLQTAFPVARQRRGFWPRTFVERHA